MLRIPALGLILIFMASPIRAQTHSGDCRNAEVHQSASTRDRIVLQQKGDTLIMDVYRVTGIGNAKLQPPARGFPAIALVRMHNFPGLENFRARTPVAALECERNRLDGIPARLACRLAQAEIDAIRREPDYLEVTLPPALLEGGGPVEIHWVDQWR